MISDRTVTIVDYGVGNVASIANMVRRVGGQAQLSGSADAIRRARKLILPGVGAFDPGIAALRSAGLEAPIAEAVTGNQAFLLGICLGMQFLLESSEEGRSAGLGFIPGRARRFGSEVTSVGLKIPHMGWTPVRPVRPSVLFSQGEDPRFYFVHSYVAECADESHVTAVAQHGVDFACSIESGRVMGVQFHPEKSHRFGMALLGRFLDL